MPLKNHFQPGINHVGEFQAAGHTFVVTGSSDIITLKYVASGITLSNTHNSNNLDFSVYSNNGVASNFTVPNDATAHFVGKFLTFKVPAGMSALVSLTNIPSGSYIPPLSHELHRVI